MEYLYCFYLYFMIVMILGHKQAQSFNQRHFHTVASHNCPEYEQNDLVLSVESFKTNTYNFGQTVETVITYRMKKNVDNLKMMVQVSRCNDKLNTTCEIFLEKATISDICDIVEMNNTVWANYLSTFNPRIKKCPIKEGIYVSRYVSGKTDIIDLSSWFSDGLWKSRNILYSGKEMIGCFETAVEIYTPLQ